MSLAGLHRMRTYYRQPEFWIVVGGSLFFMAVILLDVAVIPRFFPPKDATRAVMSSKKVLSFSVIGSKAFCRAHGVKIYGYRFSAGFGQGQENYSGGAVCWDLSKKRWEWVFSSEKYTQFNSDPSRP